MFTSKSIDLYDEIYCRLKNYQDEAEKVQKWLKRIAPSAKTLLDMACGTAEHIKYLKSDYKITGTDIDENFIVAAKKKNPECQFNVADMADFELNSKFDVITCLFSSIGYVKSVENLNKTLSCFSNHLNPGGAVLIEPWFPPGKWEVGRPHLIQIDEPDFKVCRMNTTWQEGIVSGVEFHYLVGTPESVEHFTEKHELGLFSKDEMLEAFERAGLKVEHDETGIFGRGLYMGKLPE